MLGTRLSNRYEILREIGRGGMGVVYLAYDPLLEREVAIKVILSNRLSSEMEERFRREARIVAKMDHPSIVPVHDVGQADGILYFVMPYIDGLHLRKHFESHTLNLAELVDVGIQISNALEYSHERGVIHRDIKPENILVKKQESGALRVRITDFGLAITRTTSRITADGAVVGTVSYLSPEQVLGQPVDGRSDLYSFGAVLYEYFTGEPPFNGEFQNVVYRIVHEDPVPPGQLGARIPGELQELVMRCLSKDVWQRPQNARELGDALFQIRMSLSVSEPTQSVFLPAARTVSYTSLTQSPFIGRDKELQELQQRLTLAQSGECQLVMIGGDPGIGKSRLMEEIERTVKSRRIRVLHGRFFEQDQAFPYQGFCEALQEYFSRNRYDSTSPVDFADLATDLVALFPVLSETELFRATSAPDSRSSSDSIRAKDRTQIYELLSRTFLRISAGNPLVIMLDDLQNAQISSAALEYIVRRLGPTPTLLVAAFRTTEVPKGHPVRKIITEFQGDRRFCYLQLSPLTADEHTLFLDSLSGGLKIEPPFASKIYDATEGNPYFSQELMRSLVDAGGKERTSVSGSNETNIWIDPLPSTIQHAVEKRIKRLAEDLREVIGIASVIGKSFRFRDLSLLIDGQDDLEDLLDRLVQDGFLVEERATEKGERLRFCNGIVQEVVYGSLSRRRRKGLHLRYAEELEKRNAGRLDQVYSQLLHHYSHADVPAKVVEYGLKFARKSLQAYDSEEATRALKMVLDFGDGLLEGEARILLASAHRIAGNAEGALQEFEEALKVFERSGDRSKSLQCIQSAADAAWEFRKIDQTLRWTELGLEAARKVNDFPILSRFLSLAATVANLRGEYNKANDLLAELEQVQPLVREEDQSIPAGGSLSVAISSVVNTVDPARIHLAEEVEIASNVFETLLTTDSQGSLRAGLCERWEMLQEGRSFVLTLRPNVLFHDGSLMTADVVKESLMRSAKQRKDRLPPPLACIKGIDDYIHGRTSDIEGISSIYGSRLRIDLSQSLPIYPALLTHLASAIVREVTDSGMYAGTGPFQISTTQNDLVVLRRNQNYWKGTQTRLDAIEFHCNVEASRMVQGFREGEYDLVRDLPPQELEEILRDRKRRASLVETPKRNLNFIVFNQNRRALQQAIVREGLSGVLRIHDLVRQTLGRFARPAEGLLPPGILGYDPARRRHPVSIDKIRESFAEAQVQLPLMLKGTVHPILQNRYGSLIRQILKVWEELGVFVSIEADSIESYLAKIDEPAGTDLLIGRWIAEYDDPDNFTFALFHTSAGRFKGYRCSSDLDVLMEHARQIQKSGERVAIYRRIEDRLIKESGIVPLFHDIDYRIAGSRVRSLQLSETPPYVNYSELGKARSVSLPKERGGGILLVPLLGDLTDLDPAQAVYLWQAEVIPTVFETLTRETEGSRIVPWLASEFQIEDGGRRYHFWLRDDVRFHDGKLLTVRDVRYSFERLLQIQNSPNRNLLAQILGAKAVIEGKQTELEGFHILSAWEFVLEMEQPVSFLPLLLTVPALSIVPEGLSRFDSSWREGCVGTGPFRVVRFDSGRRLEVEANPDYWRGGLPKSDGIAFYLDTTPDEIFSGFQSGRFSFAGDLLPQDVERLRRDTRAAYQYSEVPSLSTYFIIFNSQKGPLSDIRLRRKIVESLNVESFIAGSLGRFALPATGFLPPGLTGHEPRMKAPLLKEPVAPVQELQASAHSIFAGSYSPLLKKLLESLGQMGFICTIVNDKSERSSGRREGDFDLNRWVADFRDPDNILRTLFHSKEGFYGDFCVFPEIDRLIDQGRIEQDPLVRHDCYRKVEHLIYENALAIPLFYEKAYRFASPDVQNFEITFHFPNLAYERFWLKK